MVEMMKQLVKVDATVEAGRLWNQLVVGVVKGAVESSEHFCDAELVFRMTVEGSRIEYYCNIRRLCTVFAGLFRFI